MVNTLDIVVRVNDTGYKNSIASKIVDTNSPEGLRVDGSVCGSVGVTVRQPRQALRQPAFASRKRRLPRSRRIGGPSVRGCGAQRVVDQTLGICRGVMKVRGNSPA